MLIQNIETTEGSITQNEYQQFKRLFEQLFFKTIVFLLISGFGHS